MSKLNKQLCAFFENEFALFNETNADNYSNVTLPNITMGFHDELAFNSRNDLDLFVIAEPSIPNGDIVKHTFVVGVQVKDKYSSNVFDVLCEIIKHNNRKKVLNNAYKFYANYPNIPMKMEDKGAEEYNYIQFTLTLITYSNVLGIESVKMNIESSGINDIVIDFISVALNYTTNANSNGGISSEAIKTTIETGTTAYSIVCVPMNNSLFTTLREQIISNVHTNKTYILKLDSFTINCKLTNATISQEVSGYPTYQLTFVRG